MEPLPKTNAICQECQLLGFDRLANKVDERGVVETMRPSMGSYPMDEYLLAAFATSADFVV